MKKIFYKTLIPLVCIGCILVDCCQDTQSNRHPIMRQIKTVHFLIHGLCYADITEGKSTAQLDKKTIAYLARESRCAAHWRAQITQFSENEILVVIPWSRKPTGPVHRFNLFADSVLSDRFFLLDCPDALHEPFWKKDQGDFSQAIVTELQSYLLREKENWNKEELFTALHALNCSRQLVQLLKERNFSFNPQVRATAWGASFEGCVTKYSLHFRRLLGLTNPIAIDFTMTTPDAYFLLNASLLEEHVLNDSLGLYLFENDRTILAYYCATSLPATGKPVYVQLPGAATQFTVLSKQGIRLWPDPEPYHLPQAPLGHYEKPQQLVRYQAGRLQAPVGQGYVYRLAKAPVFILNKTGMTVSEFREILLHPPDKSGSAHDR